MRVSGPEFRVSAHADVNIQNRFARMPLPAGKLVTLSQLQSADAAADTAAAAVPATDALLLGGTLRPGDRVDLLLTTPASPAAAGAPAVPLKQIAFADILVLDVRRGGESIASPGAESSAAPKTGAAVLVLALPIGRRSEFAALIPRASLLLTLSK